MAEQSRGDPGPQRADNSSTLLNSEQKQQNRNQRRNSKSNPDLRIDNTTTTQINHRTNLSNGHVKEDIHGSPFRVDGNNMSQTDDYTSQPPATNTDQPTMINHAAHASNTQSLTEYGGNDEILRQTSGMPSVISNAQNTNSEQSIARIDPADVSSDQHNLSHSEAPNAHSNTL